MILAIDASRNRSGGAIAHLIGILTYADPKKFGIKKIHVWSHKKLLSALPIYPWLELHNPKELEKSIFSQVYWQYFKFHKELNRCECDILLNTDAGTVGRFKPNVTMSRDMLSYEENEMKRYIGTLSWIRLLVLRYIQNYSFKNANGVIFLTNYAADVIQSYCGSLKNIQIIPHGSHEIFRNIDRNERSASLINQKIIRCLYVSNALPYKHQWNVINAISILRIKGYAVELNLVGVGNGPSQHLIDKAVAKCDPLNNLIKQHGFVDNSQLVPYLEEADIFIFASSCENMPVTLIEAMASKLPVACSNRGPMPEILKDGGEYFNPEKPEEIAKAVEKLIINEDERKNYINRSVELANLFSWKRCSDETFFFLKSTYENTIIK